MPEALRTSLPEQEPQPRKILSPKKRGKLRLEPVEPDAFDNPEFNAAVDEAVARVPARKIERPKEPTDEEITARISEELRTGVRAEKREAELQAKEEKQRAENERRRHADDRKEHVVSEHHISESKEEPIPVENEADRLRKQISKKNAEEGRIISKMNEIRKSRGFFGALRSGIAALTGGYAKTQEDKWLEAYERDLAEIDAERDALMEDLQQLSRRPGTRATSARARKEDLEAIDTSSFVKTKKQAAKGMARDIAATFVPGVKTEFEKDQDAMEEGETTIEVPEEERTGLEAFEKSLEEPQRVKRPKKKETLTLPPDVGRMERQRMTIDRAKTILSQPVAYDLWELLAGKDGKGGKLGERPDARVAVSGSDLTQTEHPATLYVFEVAKAVRAKQEGDEAAFEAAADKLASWNKLLKIDNAYVNSVLATRVGPSDVLKGTKQRRQSVARQTARWKT
jgi:hypothetical protein